MNLQLGLQVPKKFSQEKHNELKIIHRKRGSSSIISGSSSTWSKSDFETYFCCTIPSLPGTSLQCPLPTAAPRNNAFRPDVSKAKNQIKDADE